MSETEKAKFDTIWKYPLRPRDFQAIEMPFGAIVMCAKEQRSNPTVWAIVNNAMENERRVFRVVGTGHPFPDYDPERYVWLGTCMVGPMVFHIFEISKPTLEDFAKCQLSE